MQANDQEGGGNEQPPAGGLLPRPKHFRCRPHIDVFVRGDVGRHLMRRQRDVNWCRHTEIMTGCRAERARETLSARRGGCYFFLCALLEGVVGLLDS